jgi:hypothetical protein
MARKISEPNYVGNLPPYGPSTVPRPKPPLRTPKCIFCGGVPTTKEHIWPSWSHRFIAKKRRAWASFHAVERHDRSDFFVKKYPGDPHDWQVKCVDELCNNGWMRKQENKMHPLFTRMVQATQNEPTRINVRDQNIIAIWFAIKAMVQEYRPDGGRVTHHAQRRRLYKSQQIPSDTWRIWIATYGGQDPSSLWISHPFQLLPEEVRRRRKTRDVTYYNSEIASYVLGQLFVVLIRCPHKPLVREWKHHPAVGDLRQIWPPTGYSFFWPLAPINDFQAVAATNNVRGFLRNIAHQELARLQENVSQP